MRKIYFLFFLLYCVSFSSRSQTSFQRSFGTADDEWMMDMVITPSKGYLMAGTTHQSVYLYLVDSLGTKVWSKKYSVSGINFVHLIRLMDGNYLLHGQSFIAGSFMMKVNGTGNILWSKTISYFITTIKETLEGGFLAVGRTGWPENGVMIKLDSIGNIMWKQQIKAAISSNRFRADDFTQSADSSYLVGGNNITGNRGWIGRFDKNGALVWMKTLSSPSSNAMVDISEGPGGKLHFRLNGITEMDSLANSGRQIYVNIPPWAPNDFFPINSPGGGYIVTGAHMGPESNGADVFLVKVDSSGTTVWSRLIGGPRADHGYVVKPTADGGFAIAGFAESFSDSLDAQGYLIKTDSLVTGCNVTAPLFGTTIYNITGSPYTPVIDPVITVTLANAGITSIAMTSDTIFDACVCVPPFAYFTVDSFAFFTESSAWASNWYWDFGDGTVDSTSAQPNHMYASFGTYTVCLTVSNGCGADTLCRTFSFSNNPPPISVGEITEGGSDVLVYPNPTTGLLQIKSGDEFNSVDIIDMLGNLIIHYENKGNTLNVDLNKVSPGIYFVSLISSKGNQIVKKVVKQ